MYICIDPSVRDRVTCIVVSQGLARTHTYQAQNKEILESVVGLCEEYHVRVSEIKGIAVLLGEGAFSSTRIASVVANTLSFALKIPVIGITRATFDQTTSLEELFTKQKKHQYISPTYSGEPNIGRPSSHLTS